MAFTTAKCRRPRREPNITNLKEQLSLLYSEHHLKKARYDYLFCHGKRVPWLKSWIGEGKRVLDLGCRDGALTRAFAEGNQVVGVDIDQEALRRIRERLGIETHWLDLNEEWPFEKGSFDVVVSCEILEHLLFPELILQRVQSLLKKGGISIGSIPNAFRLRNRFKFLFGNEFDPDPTHLHFFSYQKLERLLAAQFQQVEIVPLQGKILPFFPVSPHAPKKIGRLFAKDLLWKATLPCG